MRFPLAAAVLALFVSAGAADTIYLEPGDVNHLDEFEQVESGAVWTSSNPLLVHVDQEGFAYARATVEGGNAVVTARGMHRTQTFTLNVSPTPPPTRAAMQVHSPSAIADLRQKLIDLIWRGRGFPSTRLPDVVETMRGPEYPIANVSSVDQLFIVMEGQVISLVYLLKPKNSNGRAVIFHDGHTENDEGGFPFAMMYPVQRLVDAGYTVAAISMPGFGANYRPIFHYNDSFVRVNDHAQLWFMESQTFSPLAYFVEPIVAVTNHLEQKERMTPEAIIGFSGGGWSALLYAAIDPRVTRSVSIAGSLPLFIFPEAGDYEYRAPELFGRTVGYRDLYVLGTAPERTQLHIYIENDPCCFPGRDQPYSFYENEVKNAVQLSGGGNYVNLLDPTTFNHEVTPFAMDYILDIFSPPVFVPAASARRRPARLP